MRRDDAADGLAYEEEAGDGDDSRLKESGEVMKEILDTPEDIPQDLLNKAECVIVLPSVKKVALGIGASYGRGAMSCRTGEHYTGPWSAPTMMALEGGSIGFQIGGQATDIRIQAEEILRMREVTSQILSKHTGQPFEVIEKDVERDRIMSAMQAKEYGLIDEVITHRQ